MRHSGDSDRGGAFSTPPIGGLRRRWQRAGRPFLTRRMDWQRPVYDTAKDALSLLLPRLSDIPRARYIPAAVWVAAQP
jgi:hypothetical protein